MAISLGEFGNRLEVLRKIYQAMQSAQSSDGITREALDYFEQLAPGLHAAVVLLDGQTGSITIITAGKSALLGSHFPPELISAKAKRWKKGDIHIVADLQALTSLWPYEALWKAEGMRAYLMIPLISQDEFVGVLTLASETPGSFYPQHIETVRELADHLAVTLQYPRLFEQLNRRTAELEALAMVSKTLRLAETPEDMVTLLISKLNEVLGSVSGALLFFDAGEIICAGNCDLLYAENQQGKLEADKPFWKLVQNKEPLFISDVSGDIPPGLLQSLTRGKQSAALIPLKAPEGTLGLICLTFQHRHEFSLEEKNLLTTLSEMIGIALHRISVLKNLEWRIADRTRALSTLNAIAHVISQSLDLDQILDAALVMVLETFRMDTGVIYLKDIKTGKIQIARHMGVPESLHFVLNGGPISSQIIDRGEEIIITDLSESRNIPPEVISAGYHTAVSVPLTAKGEVRGVLIIASLQRHNFTQEDIDLLSSIGRQIGVAIANAQLYQHSQQLAVVEERQRLARDLHDSVTQSIYGASLYAKAALGQLSKGNLDVLPEYLQELQTTTQAALAEMRLLIYELRPLALDEAGLVATLRSRLQAVEARAGLNVDFQAGEIGSLPSKIEECLYRIAQEALNNSLRYANAHSIKVLLACHDHDVTLEIYDDGVGFEPEAVHGKGGMGLPTMQERAKKMGGDFLITSKPGEGTVVRVTLPV